MKTKNIKRLGLFIKPSVDAIYYEGVGGINGSAKFQVEFANCIYKYGTFDEYHCFCKKIEKEYYLPDKRFKIIPINMIAEYLKKYHYTCFHHTGPSLKYYLLKYRQNISKNLFPYTTTTHSISYSYMVGKTFLPYCLHKLFPFDSIFCCSEAVKKTLSIYFELIQSYYQVEQYPYEGQMLVTPHGIDGDFFRKNKISQIAAKKKFKLAHDSMVILYFGRISVALKKDILPLISIFNEILKSNPEKKIYLLIAGNNEELQKNNFFHKRHLLIETYLKELKLEKNIHFYNCPSDIIKVHLFSAADIFISLSDSIQESFGLSIIEAQASGIPVIASDWNGYRDLIKNKQNGFLIPTYWQKDVELDNMSKYKKIEYYHYRQAQSVAIDMNQLKNILEKVIFNKDFLRMLKKNTTKYSMEYDWSNSLKKYEENWVYLSEKSEFMSNKFGLKTLRNIDPIINYKNKKYEIKDFPISYYQSFKHFATEIVNENWYITLGCVSNVLIDAARNNLDTKLLILIIKITFQELSKTNKFKITQLAKILNKYGHNNIEDIIRHLMWLFKQGNLHLIK